MMKYIAVFFLILTTVFNVLAKDENNFDLVGEWFAEIPHGKVTYIFKKDGNVDWLVDSKDPKSGAIKVIKAKYKIDLTQKPITIDIFDFDIKKLKKFRLLGIISIKDKDTFRMDANPGPKTSTSHRPKKFSPKALEFKREK